MPELVLASGSPYRRALVERLGVRFRCREPLVDEEALKDPALAPRDLAEFLARAKTLSVAEVEPDAVVVGGDQLVSFDGAVLGKPGTVEAAIDQLMAVSGKTFELITAMVICHRGETVEHTDVTRLFVRPLGREEIRRYVEADMPLDCAGSFRIEGRGIALFERVETEDFTAITGLPLIRLVTELRRFGIESP